MADLIDYDSKQAAILSALRKAQELQQSEAPPVQYKQFGQIDHVIAPGPLSGVAAAINRGMGDIQEGQVNRQQSELDANQMREMQDYQRQLAAVPTETHRVLKKALSAPTGTLNQPQLQPGEIPTPQAPAQPEYEDVALTPEEQNAKRSEIAGGMYRLPKAREMAKELWKQTIDFRTLGVLFFRRQRNIFVFRLGRRSGSRDFAGLQLWLVQRPSSAPECLL